MKVTVKAAAPVATTQAPAATTTAPDTTTGPATTTTAPDTTTGPTVTETPEVPSVVTAEAVSATAVNTKTLSVEFNRDLTADEQADVLKAGNVTVANNGVTQSIKAVFENAHTLYITTSTSAKFAAGTYTITLNGDIQFTKAVSVENSDVQSIEIKSTTVEKVASGSAVKVDLLDQYGDNVTLVAGDIEITAVNKTNSTRSVSGTVENGVLKLNTNNANVDDEIILTLVYKSKALTATQTLKVVAEDYVNVLTLGTPFSAASPRIEQSTTDTRIEYKATKVYGDEADINLGGAGDYTVISSNTTIIDPAHVNVSNTNADGKKYITISNFGGTGTVTLVFVNNKTGATVNAVVTVLPDAGVPTTATIESNSVDVAAKSTAYVGITVKDNYDEVIAGENFDILPTSTNENVEVSLVRDKNDANYGKIKVDATALTESDANKPVVATISIKDKNGVVVTSITPIILTINVKDVAKPQSIAVQANANTLVVGGTATIKVSAVDQYNGQFSLKDSSYTVVATSSKTDVIDDFTVTNKEEITATAKAAGTAIVTVKVMNGETQVLATEITLTVEANSATNFTYSVADIPVLNPTGGAINNKYAQKVVVKATKKTDNTVTLDIPSSKIAKVTSDNNIVKCGQIGDDWFVYADKGSQTLTADVTANLTVLVSTDDGFESITKAVTVSKDAPKVTGVALYTDNKYETVLTNVATSAAVVASGVAINLATEDQYGVKNAVEDVITGSSVNVTNPSNVTYTGAYIEDGTLYVSDLAITGNNTTGSFKINVLVGDVFTSFTVTVLK